MAIRLQPKYFDAHLETADAHAYLADRAHTNLSAGGLTELARAKLSAEYETEINSAIDAMTLAVKLRVDSKEAWTKLGDLYAETKQYDKALKCLRAAIKIDSEGPNDLGLSSLSDPYLSMKRVFEETEWVNGDLIYNQGRVRAGIQEFRSLATQYPKADTIHYCLGELYLKLGDRASALEEYKALKSMESGWVNILFQDIYK